MKILYVEDDQINAVIMRKILASAHRVDIALTAEEALNAIENGQYDLYLLDINLGHPEISGLEICQMIRDQFPEEKKVIAVTAYSEPEDKDRFLKAGFDYYFSKPVHFQNLRQFINTLSNQSTLNP